jgi:hypothetical protein
MIPISYDLALAKERMADRLREAEQHRLVQQAKAAAREERNADHALVGARRPLTSWFRPGRKVSQVSNATPSRSAL